MKAAWVDAVYDCATTTIGNGGTKTALTFFMVGFLKH